MHNLRRFLLIGGAILVGAAGFASGEEIYLAADFNDKPLDQPIGTGGAAVGEPYMVDTGIITAIVREGPMGSRSLEISDTDDYTAGSVRFGLLNDAEVTTGMMVFAADLWFPSLAEGRSFFVAVREHGTAAYSFATLDFSSDGNVRLSDHLGYVGTIGAYRTEELTRLILEFDMDARVYDVWLDGVKVVDDRSHGIMERGVGGVFFGCTHDPDYEGIFYVDAITASDTFQAVPTAPRSWGNLKGSYRR